MKCPSDCLNSLFISSMSICLSYYVIMPRCLESLTCSTNLWSILILFDFYLTYYNQLFSLEFSSMFIASQLFVNISKFVFICIYSSFDIYTYHLRNIFHIFFSFHFSISDVVLFGPISRFAQNELSFYAFHGWSRNF